MQNKLKNLWHIIHSHINRHLAYVLLISLVSYVLISTYQNQSNANIIKQAVDNINKIKNKNMQEKKTHTNWRNFTEMDKADNLKYLTDLQIDVTQNEGTERPFTDNYNENKEAGIYVDIVSGEPLYLSTDKYDSGTGWPSFVKPISSTAITLHVDSGLLNDRIEVRSKLANSHLGHVFDDGPQQLGGKRYCMNGAALRFVPISQMSVEGYGEYISQIK